MNHETQQRPMFFVAGISVRTINKNGQAGRDIGALWQQFTQANLGDKLEEKEGNEVYCVYTDYESDHNDCYTAILGCKVSSIEYLPKGFVGKAIPAAKYNIYTPVGKLPESVGATWQHIWQSEVQRTYLADFDVYTTDGYAKIYVGVN